MKKLLSAVLVISLFTGSFISISNNDILESETILAMDAIQYDDEDWPFHWT